MEDITKFEPSSLKPTEEAVKVPFEEKVGQERLERELIAEGCKSDSDRERSTSEGSTSKDIFLRNFRILFFYF